jgi:hypothetical protein
MEIVIITCIIVFAILMIYFAKEGFKTNNIDEEYDLIKKYLLNESPLYGKNKPKIWIHTTYEIDARNWNTFSDHNSTNKNQPYIELTIQSIINHCALDFNILLINDETFLKLIPHWKWGNMSNIADPEKKNIRQYGLLKLLYFYGGIIVPNSFICFKNLESLFKPTPFVVETINKTLFDSGKTFCPSIKFIGVRNKRDLSIKKIIDELFSENMFENIPNNKKWEMIGMENDIVGKSNNIISKYIKNENWFLWSGDLFGIKTSKDGNPILIEDLMEDDYLDLPSNMYGILVDSDELMRRNKYNWLTYIKADSNNLLNGCNILSKYLNKSLIDGIITNKDKILNVNKI